MIDDRMTQGIIAGAVGAIVQDVYIFGAQVTGFTKVEYEDYAEMLIFTKLLLKLLDTRWERAGTK